MQPDPLPANRNRTLGRGGLHSARAFVGACGLAFGAACAGEPPELPDTPEPDAAAAPAPSADTTTAIGLDAITLLQRERRQWRGVPRMLPLASAPARQGRLWLGLAREPRGAGEVRLELVWVVPIGR